MMIKNVKIHVTLKLLRITTLIESKVLEISCWMTEVTTSVDKLSRSGQVGEHSNTG